MDEKRLEFPCTKKCLVYASCQTVCQTYKDYIQESCRMYKYRCFIIIPFPPKQIQQLTVLMNRLAHPDYLVNYFPNDDYLIISDCKREMPIAIMGKIRKRKDLHSHPNFPEELK